MRLTNFNLFLNGSSNRLNNLSEKINQVKEDRLKIDVPSSNNILFEADKTLDFVSKKSDVKDHIINDENVLDKENQQDISENILTNITSAITNFISSLSRVIENIEIKDSTDSTTNAANENTSGTSNAETSSYTNITNSTSRTNADSTARLIGRSGNVRLVNTDALRRKIEEHNGTNSTSSSESKQIELKTVEIQNSIMSIEAEALAKIKTTANANALNTILDKANAKFGPNIDLLNTLNFSKETKILLSTAYTTAYHNIEAAIIAREKELSIEGEYNIMIGAVSQTKNAFFDEIQSAVTGANLDEISTTANTVLINLNKGINDDQNLSINQKQQLSAAIDAAKAEIQSRIDIRKSGIMSQEINGNSEKFTNSDSALNEIKNIEAQALTEIGNATNLDQAKATKANALNILTNIRASITSSNLLEYDKQKLEAEADKAVRNIETAYNKKAIEIFGTNSTETNSNANYDELLTDVKNIEGQAFVDMSNATNHELLEIIKSDSLAFLNKIKESIPSLNLSETDKSNLLAEVEKSKGQIQTEYSNRFFNIKPSNGNTDYNTYLDEVKNAENRGILAISISTGYELLEMHKESAFAGLAPIMKHIISSNLSLDEKSKLLSEVNASAANIQKAYDEKSIALIQNNPYSNVIDPAYGIFLTQIKIEEGRSIMSINEASSPAVIEQYKAMAIVGLDSMKQNINSSSAPMSENQKSKLLAEIDNSKERIQQAYSKKINKQT